MSTEVFELRELVQDGGRGYFYGSRSYVCDGGEAGSVSLALYGKRWDGITNGPVCKKTRAIWQPGGQVGQALVTGYFTQPRDHGKARVTTRTDSQWEKILMEPEGKRRIIEGPDPANQFAEWIVVSGDNIVKKFHTMIIIQTAYPADKFRLIDPLSLERSVNKEALTIAGFGTIPAGKALMSGINSTRLFGDDLVDVDYFLLYSGPDQTWNDRVKSQLGTWVAEEVPVFTHGTSKTTKTQKMAVWKQGIKVVPTVISTGVEWRQENADAEPRECFAKKSFARYLSGIKEW